MFSTCPGASPACKSVCYAATKRFKMPNVKLAHKRNYQMSKRKDFASRMLRELRNLDVDVLRIHVAGDFYNERYINDWLKIIRRRRNVQFYAYTRSWAVPDDLAAITRVGKEPNMQMWFSFDKDMPRPPKIKGIRTAYMMTSVSDRPPCHADLVFRTDECGRDVLKYTNYRSLMCPYENGVTETTCSKCALCWKPAKSKRKNHAKVFC